MMSTGNLPNLSRERCSVGLRWPKSYVVEKRFESAVQTAYIEMELRMSQGRVFQIAEAATAKLQAINYSSMNAKYEMELKFHLAFR